MEKMPEVTVDSADMDLDEAILSARHAVQAIPHGESDAACLNGLAKLLEQKYHETREVSVLEEVIALYRRIAEIITTSALDMSSAEAFGDLGILLAQKFNRLGELPDLEEAIDISRQAVHHSTDAEKPNWLNSLSNRLETKFFRVGLLEDLQEAVTTSRQAVELTPKGHPNRAMSQGNLASRLSTRYSFTGDMADLEECLSLTLEAMKGSPGHGHDTRWLHNYGIDLGKKYVATGDIEVLNEAVSFARRAVEVTPETDLDRAVWASSLSIQLRQRYTRIGARADITEAVAVLETAIAKIAADDPSQTTLLHNLSNCLGQKYLYSGARDDLQNAISAARRAKRATPKEHRDRPAILNTLSNLLGVRFGRRGGLRTIEDAVKAAVEAIEWTEEGHPDRSKWLSTYGRQLANKAMQYSGVVSMSPEQYMVGDWADIGLKATGRLSKISRECLELAVSVTRDAINSLPPDQSNVSVLKIDLGNRLRERSVLAGRPDDLREACECFRFALNSQHSSIRIRLFAGKQLLSAALDVYDTDEAYTIAQSIIELIPLLVPNSLRSTDKQHLLTDIEGIASLAAAIALKAGQTPLVAVRMLETGRAVLASSLRDMRTDLSALQRDHPQLARDFVALRKTLDNTAQSKTSEASTEISKPWEKRNDHRFVAERKMAELVKEIQRQPGFENFLQPASEVQMLRAASNGPIVIINVSPFRCDAIMVGKEEFRHLELPKLHLKDIIDHKRQYESIQTLEWLWDALAEPVLDELGYTKIPAEDDPSDWPCVWWIPTGPLVGLPIHAAGYHTDVSGSRSALDRVISSYSSSAKSMIHGLEQPAPAIPNEDPSTKSLVLVSLHDTPGNLSNLKHAPQEVQVVDEVCQARSMNLTTVWPSPYRQQVFSALSDCFIFHFAGHGDAKRSNPLDSSILLRDWQTNPLTVEALIDTNWTHTPPFLAYLSACGTGQVRQEESLDEGMHLASAFQLAGFRHVISTLWEVDDELCVTVARKTYEYLREHGISDQSIRAALHHALRALRQDWIEERKDAAHNRGVEDPAPAEEDDEWKGYDSDESASDSDTSMTEDSEESEYSSEDERAEKELRAMFSNSRRSRSRREKNMPEEDEDEEDEEDASWETVSEEGDIDDAGPNNVETNVNVAQQKGQDGQQEEPRSREKRDIGSEAPVSKWAPRPRWIQYVHYGV
ncbi:hypothetical protein NW767_014870 [Fusarium falciforme]|nr:hypothetical protein NW767_014870 [Fusarium falciforme]KAJ4229243.1 hypothetical protein NW757_014079 [Fusarium falciforme]